MASSLPLVSIIVPSYGGGDNLKRTVESVLNQTYSSIECIVVDDNGLNTENQIRTANVMTEYKNRENVKYICHEININGSAARNTGFRNSSGTYVCVLDDDDELMPDYVETLVSVVSNMPEDYALAYVRAMNVIDGVEQPMTIFYPEDEVDMFKLFTKNYCIFACCYMMRREIFESVGGYDESFRRHQDMEFIEKVVFLKGRKVKGIDKVCYKRHLLQRNNPANPDVALKYREHYLKKMAPYISTLPKEMQKGIRDYHYMDVGICYLSHKDIFGFLKLYWKVKPGKVGNKLLFSKFISIVKRGRLRSK